MVTQYKLNTDELKGDPRSIFGCKEINVTITHDPSVTMILVNEYLFFWPNLRVTKYFPNQDF